jgi:hypothetical protein
VLVSRIAEEIFPFAFYLIRAQRQRWRCDSSDLLKDATFKSYATLSTEQLSERLKEERARAVALDDKTFKLTLSLSVGLTLVGSTAAVLIKMVTSTTIQITLTAIISLALIYVLLAGFVALGALRTLPTYGYGTQFLLQEHADSAVAADALARQELMNSIRLLRNETSYQALRNGLILLFLGLMIFIMGLSHQTLCSV